MRRVVLITPHYLFSKRRAGFHFLGDAYHRAGWEVIYLTVSLSWLSRLRRDYRLEYPVRAEANRLIWKGDRLGSFIWWTPWHPAHLRSALLNKWTTPLFSRYGALPLGDAENFLRSANLVIIESCSGVLLLDRLREMNPSARYVYRVSDDLRLLRNHPAISAGELANVGKFDLVSSPSEYIHRRFAHLPQARLQYHGLDKAAFDVVQANPYSGSTTKNLVFIGNAQCDVQFLSIAAQIQPDWKFHVIGPISGVPRLANVNAYGEIPFAETIGYLQHADAGLHTLADNAVTRASTDSLKVLQYEYCGLPIIAPEFLRTQRGHMFYYVPEDRSSIASALTRAVSDGRYKLTNVQTKTWDELAESLADGPLASN